MSKLFGSYGIWEIFISIAVGLCLLLLDSQYLYRIYLKGISQQLVFEIIFTNFIFLFLLMLPYIAKKVKSLSDNNIKQFLELPSDNDKLTFTAFSNFLGNQALGSFFATVMIYTGKGAFQNYGEIFAAFYMSFLFITSITLTTLSLIRFVWYFTKYNGLIYGIATVSSIAIMFAFLNVGLKLGECC